MTLLAGRAKWCIPFLSFLLSVAPARAASYTYSGPGGDLNVATFDGMGNPVQGVTAFSIPVADLALVNPGDSVMLSLIGLQYPYAGDLEVTLSLNGLSGDVFNQIGAVNPGDPGYSSQFGNSTVGCSGNYNFDSSFSGDLWAAAAPPLGYGDSIPCGDYAPTTAFSNTNDNLSYLFSGMPIGGNWTLTIYDNYPPFGGGAQTFVPGLTAWSLTVQATPVPEPATTFPLALSSSLLLWTACRRRRHIRASRHDAKSPP